MVSPKPQARSRVKAAARPSFDASKAFWLGAGATVLGLMSWAQQAAAEEVITTHGYNFFGELEYPADFDHLRYVNPDAPKGGDFHMGTWNL